LQSRSYGDWLIDVLDMGYDTTSLSPAMIASFASPEGEAGFSSKQVMSINTRSPKPQLAGIRPGDSVQAGPLFICPHHTQLLGGLGKLSFIMSPSFSIKCI
jgi:hypothetical protein